MENDTIKKIDFFANEIEITLQNRNITIKDVEEHCCENRFFTTDSDLKYFFGATLLSIETNPGCKTFRIGQEEFDDYIFLDIKTSKGVITFEAHTVHNGYYDGFNISIHCSKIEY